MPDGAVYVGRPTKWGNPFVVEVAAPHPARRRAAHAEAVDMFDHLLSWGDEGALVPYPKPGQLMDLSDRRERILTDIEELRGRDLVCWCDPSAPCHADVLLELANGEVTP